MELQAGADQARAAVVTTLKIIDHVEGDCARGDDAGGGGLSTAAVVTSHVGD